MFNPYHHGVKPKIDNVDEDDVCQFLGIMKLQIILKAMTKFPRMRKIVTKSMKKIGTIDGWKSS